MNYPDLGRYDDLTLGRMEYSYSSLAATHGENGHFALATWARKMHTHVVIEMNKRAMRAEAAKQTQMTIDQMADDPSAVDVPF